MSNEAKDNVKYLYTLEKFFGQLQKSSPVRISLSVCLSVHLWIPSGRTNLSVSLSQTSMLELIPSLMTSIRMIFTVSQYYNTSERMTCLLLKVTNQMISSCRAYLSQGVARIWDHSRYSTLGWRPENLIWLNQTRTWKNNFVCEFAGLSSCSVSQSVVIWMWSTREASGPSGTNWEKHLKTNSLTSGKTHEKNLQAQFGTIKPQFT